MPFDSEAIYALLVDEEGVPLYATSEERWCTFPGHNNSKMSIPVFLESLADAVDAELQRSANLNFFVNIISSSNVGITFRPSELED